MTGSTRSKLVGALATLVGHGIAGASARTIAAAAGVNQALVFHHFGTVDELLVAACRHGAEQRVAAYRDRLDDVRTVRELLDHPRLAPAAAAGLALRTDEIEEVLKRVLGPTPLVGLVDVAGLAKAISSAFVGLQLYEGVDVAGADAAFGALEQLAALVAAVDPRLPGSNPRSSRLLTRGPAQEGTAAGSS